MGIHPPLGSSAYPSMPWFLTKTTRESTQHYASIENWTVERTGLRQRAVHTTSRERTRGTAWQTTSTRHQIRPSIPLQRDSYNPNDLPLSTRKRLEKLAEKKLLLENNNWQKGVAVRQKVALQAKEVERATIPAKSTKPKSRD